MSSAEPLHLSIIIPPGNERVEYYAALKRVVLITNVTQSRILLERILLRFQSDSEERSVVVPHDCGVDLAPNQGTEQSVLIVPTAEFLQHTNTFDVVAWFRVTSASGFDEPMSEPHKPPAYILVSDPKPTLGRLFISFKQPEDLRLKNTIERIARRAGFTPWSADRDSHIGGDQWNEIEEAIGHCVAAVFLWTRNTDFTEGVKREVGLCRKYGVREKPLFESGIPVPEPYRDKRIHYEWFDLETPTHSFVKVVHQLRDEITSKKL